MRLRMSMRSPAARPMIERFGPASFHISGWEIIELIFSQRVARISSITSRIRACVQGVQYTSMIRTLFAQFKNLSILKNMHIYKGYAPARVLDRVARAETGALRSVFCDAFAWLGC